MLTNHLVKRTYGCHHQNHPVITSQNSFSSKPDAFHLCMDSHFPEGKTQHFLSTACTAWSLFTQTHLTPSVTGHLLFSVFCLSSSGHRAFAHALLPPGLLFSLMSLVLSSSCGFQAKCYFTRKSVQTPEAGPFAIHSHQGDG